MGTLGQHAVISRSHRGTPVVDWSIAVGTLHSRRERRDKFDSLTCDASEARFYDEQVFTMSNVCQVTGKRPSTGFNVSHSHRRTKRWFKPNIQKQRFWVPNEKRWITLTVSTTGIKTINKNGIESVLADMRRRGVKV